MSESSCFDHPEECAGLYLLGLLDDAERQRFDSLVRTDEPTRRELRDHSETLSALAELVPAEQPPASLRERLLQRV